jgi:protein-disulfide isomerase
MESAPPSSSRWFKPLMWLIVLFVGVFLGTVILIDYQKSKRSQDTFAELTGGYASQASVENINAASRPAIPKLETTDDPYLGPAQASVVVVEFGDFECPYCRQIFSDLREITVKYQDRVKFIFRDFPLSEIHAQAQAAAEAANCAFQQGNEKFWAYHDKLFQNQENLSEANYKIFARQIGLDEQRFEKCLASGETRAEINEDFLDGAAQGVTGTPTFFFNGRKVQGVIPKDKFEKALDLLLE